MVLLFEGQNNFADDKIGGCYRTFDIVDNVEIKMKEKVNSNFNYVEVNGNDLILGSRC